MVEKPGFEFRPYDEELVGFYLRQKLLGNHSLVDGVIREIKICSLDPWDLRCKFLLFFFEFFFFLVPDLGFLFSQFNRRSNREILFGTSCPL